MFDRIFGRDIATYIRAHRGLIIVAVVLSALSALFVVVPAYLVEPLVDEGMKGGTALVEWRIPWFEITLFPFSAQKTELTLVRGITPNHLLVVLAIIAFLSVVFKSITIYLSHLAGAAFSNRAIKALRIAGMKSKFHFHHEI